ncbi:MAG: CheR family methyltransferase [Bacteroidales bacterium]|jgi:chemotaxis protein methyltransferase CheR|nr:CheR family methyltransferase [Bacteroidales bacterium]
MTLTDQEVHFFVNTLKNASNYDFSEYSEKSLKRRLQKILIDNRLDLVGVINKLKSDSRFLEQTVKDITVNTTELFRDPQIWQNLRYRILPKFANNKNINIWHAGCSTGQEVYSMMILLNEMGLLDKAKIFASDLNTDALDAAKKGIYKYRFNIGYLDNFDKVIKENPFNYEEYNEIPYTNYFKIDKVTDTITMHDFLRKKPIFRQHDLVKGGNLYFAKFDLILCRNVIIYFKYCLQNKVFRLFYDHLYTNGYLVLGMHETMLGEIASKFEKRGQSYRKK